MRGRKITKRSALPRAFEPWDSFSRWFNSPMFRTDLTTAAEPSEWFPTVDITETKNAYKLKVEIPEVEKDNINVTIENGVLTIDGFREHSEEEEGEQFHRVERSYGRFVRRFGVPDGVDDGNVEATFKNGMLYLTLPKVTNGKDVTKRIEIS